MNLHKPNLTFRKRGLETSFVSVRSRRFDGVLSLYLPYRLDALS